MSTNGSLIEDLYNQSNAFSSPITKSLPDFIEKITLKDIHELLRRLKDDPLIYYRDYFRLYIDGKRKKRFSEKIFLDSLPNLNVGFIDWLEEYFGEKEFLLFINYSSSWSNKLAVLLANFSLPLVRKFPPLSLSLESHIIIGKYRTTPFGVHIDDANDRVIHFNISDNEKYLHLWEKEKYRVLTGSYDYIETMESIEDHKTTYIIKKNDAFVLPAAFYHVGESPKISVVFALALSKLSKKDLFSKIIEEMKDLINNSILEDVNYDNFEPESILEELLNENFLKSQNNLNRLFFSALDIYRKRMESNHFFVERSFITIINFSLETLKKTKITKLQPFNISYGVLDKRIYLFARGHKFVCNENQIIIPILDYIKINHTFSFEDLQNINKKISNDFLVKLVNWLLSVSAFTFDKEI